MDFLPSLLGNKALRRDAARSRGELLHEVQGAVPMFSAEQKAVFTSYASRFYQSGKVLGEPEWTVERAVAQAYGRVIWVFKAVNTISGDSSRLDVMVGDKDTRTADDSDVADLLNEGQCNPLEKGKQMRKRLVAQRLLSPYGVFLERTRNNGGRPMRYDLLPPHRTKIIPAEQGDDLVSHVEVSRPSGGVYRIEWEDVLWFRDPHPTDPFRGSTPLEAAGMSVELDYFARLYNTSFMRNDGRPGGVLAVRGTGEKAGDVSETTLNRLESRFGKGPAEAGKITAITGDLTYQDFGSTPRDMQYAETARTARDELLAAFGTPMSVLGYAADRTFDNAGQEERNYWTITMRSNNEIVETEFAGEVEGQGLWLDTSGIEVLQQAEQAKLAEAREEVGAGVRSIWSYAQMAGIEDIEESAFTRALYIPAGKTPLPGRAEDAEALGMGPAAGSVPGEDGATAEGEPAADGGAPEQIGSPADAVAAIAAAPTTGPASPADAVAALEGKVLDTRKAIAAPRPPRSIRVLRVIREGETKESARAAARSEQGADDTAALERSMTHALTGVMEATLTRTETRLTAPKTRKGTRHWQPEFAVDTRLGNKALDAAKAVDDDAVEQDTHAAVEMLVATAAVLAAGKVAQDLTGAAPAPRCWPRPGPPQPR